MNDLLDSFVKHYCPQCPLEIWIKEHGLHLSPLKKFGIIEENRTIYRCPHCFVYYELIDQKPKRVSFLGSAYSKLFGKK